MDTSPASVTGRSLRRYGFHLPSVNLLQSTLNALLEYTGAVPSMRSSPTRSEESDGAERASEMDAASGEINIPIMDDHHLMPDSPGTSARGDWSMIDGVGVSGGRDAVSGETHPLMSTSQAVGARGISHADANAATDGASGGRNGTGGRADQRQDIHHIARCVEQILPFSILLTVVFIRQHLQGLFITIWITLVMLKSNDVLQKQTALKGERKFSLLCCVILACMIHVFGVYWWCKNDDLLRPLVLVPLKEIPSFWHAIFIIMVNDTLVRQAAMAVKCILLMYYKNGRGRNYRRQGHMLTLVEYFVLLYRGLLPAPVWYRFFLNKEYGSLFSSLTTGVYLTFKLTTIVEKVRSLLAALKALSHTDRQFGSYATAEQVLAAGDTCAICQEKMHVPLLLRCKHIFCEDCVSEWCERERTCPLCRAVVRPLDIRSFGDGSTNLLTQLF